MGMIQKVKNWWKANTPAEKILYIIGGVSVAASAVSIATCEHFKKVCGNIAVDVKLYPKGDLQNPIDLTPDSDKVDFSKSVPSPSSDGRYDPYELSRDLFNLLGNPADDDILSPEEFDEAKEKALQLAWDLAAREGKLEKAESEIPPYQVYD